MLVERPLHAARCQLSYGCDQNRQREKSLEAGFVGRLVRPVVDGVRDVPPSGALLGVLWGVAIRNGSLGAQGIT